MSKKKKLSNKQIAVKKVTKWLRRNYPTSLPTTVKWIDHLAVDDDESLSYYDRVRGDYGICFKYPDRNIILISNRANTKSSAIDTLLHEWAHAKIKESGHGPKYWIQYGKIYVRYIEGKGYEEARKEKI